MSLSRALRGAAILSALSFCAGACAEGQSAFGSGNDDVEDAVGGNGGASGSDDDGPQWPCGVDCALIEAPTCFESVCNQGTKTCEVVAAEDFTPCDDGQFCTVGEICLESACTSGTVNDCGQELGACQLATCNEETQSCSTESAPDGTVCSAADLCTVNATCNFGQCVGAPKNCTFAPLPNDCHVSECNPANGQCEAKVEPTYDGLECKDESDKCTVSKVCDDQGSCGGGEPKDCSAQANYCNAGLCDSSDGSCYGEPTNANGFCEDGDACTTGETCDANGGCAGGQMGLTTQSLFFEETFADNSAGWTLDTEWQIGPTTLSEDHNYGGPDPVTDTSDSSDNGVAGVVLGGNAGKTLHEYYYLTSPSFDASTAQGPLWLEFQRWLNSDYTPFMQNIVEVFDGQVWRPLWETDNIGVKDDSWQTIRYDIAAFKNSNMQVRFGFRIGSSGVFSVSQWNIDDVRVADVFCDTP